MQYADICAYMNRCELQSQHVYVYAICACAVATRDAGPPQQPITHMQPELARAGTDFELVREQHNLNVHKSIYVYIYTCINHTRMELHIC